MYLSPQVSTRYSRRILIRLKFSRTDFRKNPQISYFMKTVQWEPPSRSMRTDRHAEGNIHFLQFCERLKKWAVSVALSFGRIDERK